MGFKSIAIGAVVALAALSGAYWFVAHNERTKAYIKLNENIIKAVRSRAGINAKIDDMGAVAL